MSTDPYNWLREYRFDNLNFDLIEDKKEQSKELFCCNTTILFWELCLKRVQELEDGYQYAKAHSQKVNMALLERAAVETLAVALKQIINFEELVNSMFEDDEKNNKYTEDTKKLFLGLRSFDKKERITSTNIFTYLEKINNYLKKFGEVNLLEMYEDLSNFCHPNLSGLAGNYYPKILKMTFKNTPETIQNPEYLTVVLLLLKHFDEKIQECKGIVREFTPDS